MKSHNIRQVMNVIDSYNADHDIGPDCPVTWREERLAQAVIELSDDIEKIKKQVAAVLEAVPSANKDQ